MDMWSGYLNFYTSVSSGDISSWWAQHNEHRIILAKIFFWIDIAWFRGEGWFLLVVNFVLLLASAITFALFNRENNKKQLTNWMSFFIVTWMFSWCQHENMTWGFQSQFILAQLLPLLAFYLLHKSIASEHKELYFIAAITAGSLAAGSMANGVLALPLMLAFTIITRGSKQRIITLFALAAIVLYAYFNKYTAPVGHGSLRQAIQNSPLGLLQYVAIYLGGPFYYIFGKSATAEVIAATLGLFLVLASGAYCVSIYKNTRSNTLQLSLLFFILYIGGTALGTAGGRLFLGLEQALSSRYMTPALMAWLALFIIYTPSIVRRIPNAAPWLFLTIILAMLPLQMHALHSDNNRKYQEKIAALALALRVPDQVAISTTYPSAEAALSLSEDAQRKHLSFFSQQPYWDVIEKINRTFVPPTATSPTQCIGHIDEIQPIQNNKKYIKLRGWAFDQSNTRVPEYIYFLDKNNRLIGAAFTGQSRKDVMTAINTKAEKSGFSGYISTRAAGSIVAFVDPSNGCIGTAQVPNLLFYIEKPKTSASNINVTLQNIVENNSWNGGDFEKSKIKGLRVIGSRVTSDSDIGDIVFTLKKGDRLLYRSGPTSGQQTLKITGKAELHSQLPIAPEWITLDFSNPTLPNEFTATFIDNGSGWGEWSAIAVKAE
jgi:hypothetical protein